MDHSKFFPKYWALQQNKTRPNLTKMGTGQLGLFILCLLFAAYDLKSHELVWSITNFTAKNDPSTLPCNSLIH